MQPVLSREQMRAFDAHAIARCHVPSLVLMENAGRGAFERFRQHLSLRDPVLVLAGPGNNGGDGLVVARHLLRTGHEVSVMLFARIADLKGDARLNADAFAGLGGRVRELGVDAALPDDWSDGVSVVIDALFGTGLSRPLDGAIAFSIRAVNESGVRVFSLDIPSGLDADSGRVLGVALHAERTVTFGHLKLGLLGSASRDLVGALELVDIGVPSELWRKVGNSAWITEERDVAVLLAAQPEPAHKGQAGRVLVVAGAPETLGAARLCAHGALRGGAGLVKVATFSRAAHALQASNWEVMTTELDAANPELALGPLLSWASAVVLGPGFGTDESARIAARFVVANAKVPVIVDADGLNLFVDEPTAFRVCDRLLLTPHPGEAGRLLGLNAGEVEIDRFAALGRLCQLTGGTVLLKGPRTLIAGQGFADRVPRINTSGSAALATAGSGDVLSGFLAALCCHLPPHEAALAGAWLHGRAAELYSAAVPRTRGLLAHELADRIPQAIATTLATLPGSTTATEISLTT